MIYKVTVNIITIDEKGKSKSKDFDYTYENENPIIARNQAIEKVKEIEFDFEKEKFDSFFEAQLKGFKNVKTYSINLMFLPDNGFGGCLYGEDEEETIQALESEVYHYAEEDGIPLTEIEYEDEEWEYVEVIEHNLDFFIN